MTVYDNVKALANERNLTIKAIEDTCGLANGSISKWTQSTPKADILYRVAKFFDEPIEYFLTGIRTKTDPTEEIILDAYRKTDATGKARIIQIAMNERDRLSTTTVLRAARSKDDAVPTVETRSTSDINKLKNADTVTSDDEI